METPEPKGASPDEHVSSSERISENPPASTSSEPDAVKRFARAGAVWTTVFATAFAWEMSAAVLGRDAFAQRFGAGGRLRVGLELGIVLIAATVWVMGALGMREQAPAIEGHRRLQWTAGTLGLGFVLYYSWLVWLPAVMGADSGTVYEILRDSSPHYGAIAIYVIGISAVALIWEQTLLVWAGASGWVKRQQTMRWFRVMSALAALAFFVVSLNGASHFVTGRGLLWSAPMVSDETEPVSSPEAPVTSEPGEETSP